MSRRTRSLLAACLLLLCCGTFLSGCQSVGGYAPLCQSDDDCASHQRCDLELGACTLKPEYPACDPSEAFDRCPVATQCDEEARACLPRPFRIAWVYSFASSRYERRQTANLLKYLSESIIARDFPDLLCPPDTACSADQVEFVFIDAGDETSAYQARIIEAYQETPFDIALPIFSSHYSGALTLSQELLTPPLDLLVFGRLNRNAAVVTQEFALGYQPPPLPERFDYSIGPVQYDELAVAARILREEMSCQNPLMIYRDNPAYRLNAPLADSTWPRYGYCPNILPLPDVPQTTYPQLIETLRGGDYDCVYFNNASEELYEILLGVSTATDLPPIKWLYQRLMLDQKSASSETLKALVQTQFSQHTWLNRLQVDSPRYQQFYDQTFLPAYQALLESQDCLQKPTASCADFACPNTSMREVCSALNCEIEAMYRVHPSCLELSCFSDAPPAWCDTIGCQPRATECAYPSPSFLETNAMDLAMYIDMVTVSLLLAQRHALQSSSDPLSRSALRDLFYDILVTAPDHLACGYPDLETCRAAMRGDQPIHYSGLSSPFELGQDGRMTYRYDSEELYRISSEGEYQLEKTYSSFERQRAITGTYDMPTTCAND